MRHLRSARHRKLIEELVRARTAAGLSQRTLAARLKRSPSYISKFEAGERRLEVCEFADLCAAVDVDAPELLRRVLR
jgi:transcriptional regulator with XRE-family HTH domain